MQELNAVAKKYGQPRRSEILYDLPQEEAEAREEVPDYPVTVFFTREGYLKKIPPQSLRTAGAHKLKEGDEIVVQAEARNNLEALFLHRPPSGVQDPPGRVRGRQGGADGDLTCPPVWGWRRGRTPSPWC